jgi:hypothetical protein
MILLVNGEALQLNGLKSLKHIKIAPQTVLYYAWIARR